MLGLQRMHDKDPIDRVRRRLLKMAVYVPPMMVSLSTARAHAGRIAPTAAAKAGVAIQAQAKAQAKVG